jgi:hypothetical protein
MTMEDFWEIVEEVIRESDVVVEVLDARMPEETRNSKAERLVRLYRKPLIFVANKMDLISSRTMKKYQKLLRETAPCIFVSIRSHRGVTFLKRKIFEIAKKRSRGKVIKVGVIGYPNTGKSSLINALAGKRKAAVGSKPGVTRGLQWIGGGPNMRLTDTPGVIPMTEEDEVKKALIGVIDPPKLSDPEGVALEIVKIFLEGDKEILEKTYNIKIAEDEPEEILEKIALARNMLKKGGVVDVDRVCFTVINDWQKGKLLLG